MKWVGLVVILAYIALVACDAVKIVKNKDLIEEKAPITDASSGHRVYPVVESIDGKPVTHFYTAFRVAVVPPASSSGVVPPASSSGVVPPASSSGVVPPARSHGAVPPARSHGAVPPARSHGAVPPARSHGAVPPARNP